MGGAVRGRAVRGGAVRGGAVRGGAVRGGAVRGGATSNGAAIINDHYIMYIIMQSQCAKYMDIGIWYALLCITIVCTMSCAGRNARSGEQHIQDSDSDPRGEPRLQEAVCYPRPPARGIQLCPQAGSYPTW